MCFASPGLAVGLRQHADAPFSDGVDERQRAFRKDLGLACRFAEDALKAEAPLPSAYRRSRPEPPLRRRWSGRRAALLHGARAVEGAARGRRRRLTPFWGMGSVFVLFWAALGAFP